MQIGMNVSKYLFDNGRLRMYVYLYITQKETCIKRM